MGRIEQECDYVTYQIQFFVSKYRGIVTVVKSRRTGWGGGDMWHAWGRGEVFTEF
jgi:hypothetical protein